MEIRDHTVSFAKRKARAAFRQETEISKQLEELHYKMCSSENLSIIDDILNDHKRNTNNICRKVGMCGYLSI